MPKPEHIEFRKQIQELAKGLAKQPQQGPHKTDVEVLAMCKPETPADNA